MAFKMIVLFCVFLSLSSVARTLKPQTELDVSSRVSLKGILSHRNLRFIIDTSDSDGVLYTVKDKLGAVLVERMSEKELKVRHPDYWSFIQGISERFPRSWTSNLEP